MKIAIIGLGISGVFYALLRKKFHKEDEIFFFEKNKENEGLRKVLVAGNGKVNLGNENITNDCYNDTNFIREKLKIASINEYKKFLKELGIYTVQKNGTCFYPISLDGKALYEILILKLKEEKIVINYDSKILDYETIGDKVVLFTKDKKHTFDKLIFATGGCSSPILGSDGSIVEIFKKHQIPFEDFKPGLTGIKTNLKFKKIDGARIEGSVKIFSHNHLIHEEDGEILFKKDGLSGIIMFNALSILNRTSEKNNFISIDFVSKHLGDNLKTFMEEVVLNSKIEMNYMLDCLINSKLKKFFLESFPQYNKEEMFNLLRDFKVIPIGDYGFTNSHVSIGGIKLESLDGKFSLIKNKNISFVGEVLNIDGLCGGYNILFCFISSYIAAK